MNIEITLANEVSSNETFSSSLGSSEEEPKNTTVYVLFAIASPLVFALTNAIDKTAVSKRVKHTPSYIIMMGIFDVFASLIIAACCDWSAESLSGATAMDFLCPVISSIFWGFFIYLYYIAFLLADASIVVGVYYLYPLLVCIFSVIFLHDRIGAVGYVGIGLLVVGAVSLSLNFIGMICDRCKKSRDDGLNRERSLVPGSYNRAFQSIAIPASRGALPISVMHNQPKGAERDKEAGCAPGVECWFPCATWYSNCLKVLHTKSDTKTEIKNEEPNDSPAVSLDEEREKKPKKRIDSRKSLESDRNARVRCASAAAVNATVNRDAPDYDTVVAEKKNDQEQEEESKDKNEEGNDENKHHHHHKNKKEEPQKLESDSEEDDEDEVDEKLEKAIEMDDLHHNDVEDRDVEEDEEETKKEEEEEEELSLDMSKDTNFVIKIVKFCQRHKDSKALLIGVLAPLIVSVALCEFMLKVSTNGLNAFNVCSISFFSLGCMMIFVVFVTPLNGAKYFMCEVKRNWVFCVLSDVFTLFAQFLLIMGMSGLPASIVSSLAAIQPFITLCLERIFGIASDTIKECLSYKLVPIVLVVSGVIILSLTVVS